MRLAFITAAAWPALSDDDLHAARELRSRGHHVEGLVWNSAPLSSYDGFDAVVMRSPWDWYRQPLAFAAFLERLDDVHAPVFNPPAMLRDFLDKTYLPKLAQLGATIVPTRVLHRSALQELPRLLSETGWMRAVVKPARSANSFGAHLLTPSDARWVLERLSQEGDHDWYLVQRYLEEIERDGEWSLVFFAGVFSHAVRKHPKAGDFRVQFEHGGSVSPATPAPEIVAAATLLLARAVPGALYARVDGVLVKGVLHLMELEVVEPELFFRFDPEAPTRFADALESFVAQSTAER